MLASRAVWRARLIHPCRSHGTASQARQRLVPTRSSDANAAWRRASQRLEDEVVEEVQDGMPKKTNAPRRLDRGSLPEDHPHDLFECATNKHVNDYFDDLPLASLDVLPRKLQTTNSHQLGGETQLGVMLIPGAEDTVNDGAKETSETSDQDDE